MDKISKENKKTVQKNTGEIAGKYRIEFEKEK